MATLTMVDSDPGRDRLRELGVEPEWLTDAILAGEAEAMLCTLNDPPNFAGISRHAHTVRILREKAVPHGWKRENPRNSCRIVSPGREIAIIAASGNELTGLNQRQQPSTKYGKGVTLVDAVAANAQLEFDLGLDPELLADDQATGIETWVLLYYRDKNQIRAELSRPESMVGGFIDQWAERIILAPISVEPSVFVEEPPADEYDVTVERRERPA